MSTGNTAPAMVWLDLDDTLIDFRLNSRCALDRLYRTEGLDRLFATPELWRETYERHNHALWDLYSRGLTDRPTLRRQRFMLPLTEGGCPEDEAARLTARFDTLYLDYLAEERATVPGALELLESLRRAGIPTGVLSNGFREVQYRKMDSAGITPYINITVLSDEIDINKPDLRIYEYAALRAALELGVEAAPSGHLLIGDNLSTDIAGALASGWRAVWLDRSDDPSVTVPQGAVRVTELGHAAPLTGLPTP